MAYKFERLFLKIFALIIYLFMVDGQAKGKNVVAVSKGKSVVDVSKGKSVVDVSKGKSVVDRLRSLHEIGASIDNNDIKTDLWIVGTYIAAHKYFGADFRYLTGDVGPDDQVFYKKFPSPTLKDLDQTLSKTCASSAMECVREILPKAKASGSLQYLMKAAKELDPFAPFQNNYESFKFRQTAMYYLCWHTQLKDPFLEFVEGTKTCLEHLNAVYEIPQQKRDQLKKSNTRAIDDIRDASFKKDKFTCAHLWFCPDPCYGRQNGGNFNKRDFKVKDNPCLQLKNSECKWKIGSNFNFEDLIRNKFNITCDCESERRGFQWNSRFEFCVDVDECYEKTAVCPDNRICKNTVGNYMCTCQKGYEVNSKTDECERSLILHQSATLLQYVAFETQGNTNKDKDFILELLEFVGLSGSINLQFQTLIMCVCLTLNMVIFDVD